MDIMDTIQNLLTSFDWRAPLVGFGTFAATGLCLRLLSWARGPRQERLLSAEAVLVLTALGMGKWEEDTEDKCIDKNYMRVHRNGTASIYEDGKGRHHVTLSSPDRRAIRSRYAQVVELIHESAAEHLRAELRKRCQ